MASIWGMIKEIMIPLAEKLELWEGILESYKIMCGID